MKLTLGSLQKKGTRYYLVLSFMGRQKWITLKTSDLIVARQRALSTIFNLGIAPPDPTWDHPACRLRNCANPVTVGWDELLDSFLAKSLGAVSASSESSYRRWIAILKNESKAECPAMLGKEEATEIISRLVERYVSCRRMVAFFALCWRTAGLDASIWETSPAQRRHLLDSGRSREFYRRLTVEEVRHIYYYLREVDISLADMVAIGYYTGLRLSDVAQLDSFEVSQDRSFLCIVPNKTRHKKRRPLTIPLVREAAEAVSRLMDAASHAENPETNNQNGGTYLFGCELRKRPTKKLTRAFRAVGLKNVDAARASFHSLRATFITMMDEAGVPPNLTDSITGHAGGGMHSRYTQPSLDAMRSAILRAITPISNNPLEKTAPSPSDIPCVATPPPPSKMKQSYNSQIQSKNRLIEKSPSTKP